MIPLTFHIIFSIMLLPINLCCVFWIFREALNLSGITTREFFKLTSHTAFPSNRRHGMKKRLRFLVRFFNENSSDSQKSIQLLRTFCICTLPGLAALMLAEYAARNPNHLKYTFIGNLILVLINIILAYAGRIYRKSHPLDERTAELLEKKRANEKEKRRATRTKDIIVYTLIGMFFFTILLGFHLGIANISSTYIDSTSIGHNDVNTILNEKGFETANIPTTYWFYEENKLKNVCAGVKDDTKFEFYEYTNDETTDLVYRQIVYDITPDMEPNERDNYETTLPDSNRMFTVIIDDIYYLIAYKKDTVIYAYSSDGLEEINDILVQMGYLNNR